MALLTALLAFLYHLPHVYKWLLRPYYVASLFMSVAFLAIRKTPGVCDHLSTQREDGNPCDFDWVRIYKCSNIFIRRFSNNSIAIGCDETDGGDGVKCKRICIVRA